MWDCDHQKAENYEFCPFLKIFGYSLQTAMEATIAPELQESKLSYRVGVAGHEGSQTGNTELPSWFAPVKKCEPMRYHSELNVRRGSKRSDDRFTLLLRLSMASPVT